MAKGCSLPGENEAKFLHLFFRMTLSTAGLSYCTQLSVLVRKMFQVVLFT